MLPILGVGSAALAIGLAVRRNASHRAAHAPPAADPLARRDRPSGIQARQAMADLERDEDAALAPVPLTSEFWDATPESDSESLIETLRPAAPVESYDAVDTEDLTAEWLARATETRASEEGNGFESDDPAEIPADSLSMISQASRDAAAFDGSEAEDDEPPYER